MNGPRSNGPKMNGGQTGVVPLIVDLLRQTFARPREAARRVVAMGEAEDRGTLWLVLVVVAILASLLSHAILLVFAGPDEGALMGGPVVTALIQCGVMATIVWAVAAVGRRFGGHGGWNGALAVTIWLEVVAMAMQLLQVVALLLLPPLADLVSMMGLGLFFVLLSLFVAELHGFRSAPLVFLGIIGTIFAAAVILSIVLALLGVGIRV